MGSASFDHVVPAAFVFRVRSATMPTRKDGRPLLLLLFSGLAFSGHQQDWALRRTHEMSTRSSVAVILICGFTALLPAQAPPAPPKPGPEHKKLEYFLGKWT